MPARQTLAAVLCAATLLCAGGALAGHDPGTRARVPDRPGAGAPGETVGGVIETLTVHDRRHGSTLRYFALRDPGGERIGLSWLPAQASLPGASVRLEGRRTEGRFFVDRAEVLREPAASFQDRLPANARRYAGKLEFLHADDFDRDRCELQYVLTADDGVHLRLDMAVVPDVLEQGMSLTVDGVPADDGLSVVPGTITIEASVAQADRVSPTISGTTQVLVILIKFADSTAEPYTQSGIAATVFSGTSSVANYFGESSYGRHGLAGTVTPWFTASFAKPTTCDYSRVSNEALTLARAAGYVTSNYQKFVYVFPKISACSWAGLGGGSSAWINQAASTLVIGHELGHTFGLGHASSLRCTDGGVASPIEGTCTRSEYGDRAEIMGNSRAAHLTAPHKDELAYFGAGAVRVHAGGTATYTLSPLASPGGALYALKIPAAARRTYWLEWRQPVGFDAALPAGLTGGALVHIAAPTDWACDTCLLDMTPATTSFDDASLAVGQTFDDATTRASVSVLARTATGLTVSVTTPMRPTYSDVPATHVGYSAIEALAWHGIAIECGTAPLRYCPDVPITRAEMAAFVERAKRGPAYAFTATGTRFADVPLSHWAAKYIEQLHIDGITSGCAANPLRFCPDAYITRAQMAPFLLKARYGSTLNPGTASGTVFADVPATHAMAAWIERLYSYQVTSGCTASPRNYCPEATVTRAQMAIFLMRAFGLSTPPA